MAVYSGVNQTTPVRMQSAAGDTNSTSHQTPEATANLGDWVVSFWSDRSTATRTYTAPSSVQVRSASADSGSLTVQSLVADSNGPVAQGLNGKITAVSDAAATASEWTILLQPASLIPRAHRRRYAQHFHELHRTTVAAPVLPGRPPTHPRYAGSMKVMSPGGKHMGQLGWRASMRLGITGALILGFATVLVSTPAAHAAQPSVAGATRAMPSTVPSAITPAIDNGQVVAIAQVGNTMVVGGTFTSVAGVSHSYVLAFDANTGAIVSGFNPTLNGASTPSSPARRPARSTSAGSSRRSTASPRSSSPCSTSPPARSSRPSSRRRSTTATSTTSCCAATGSTSPACSPRPTAVEHDGLVTLDPTTGALDPFMNVQLTGHHNDSGSGAQGWVGATDIDVTPDGSDHGRRRQLQVRRRPAAQPGGADRPDRRAAPRSAPWATTGYAPYCYNWAFDQYVRGVVVLPGRLLLRRQRHRRRQPRHAVRRGQPASTPC